MTFFSLYTTVDAKQDSDRNLAAYRERALAKLRKENDQHLGHTDAHIFLGVSLPILCGPYV